MSFPPRGNGLYQALDSGLRRNDGAFGSLPRLLFFCCSYHSYPVVIPAKAGIHAYRDVGGRAASGTSRRGRRAEGLRDCRFLSARARLTEYHPSMPFPLCGNGSCQPLDALAFVPDATLSPTSCRRASMQAGLRRNDGAFWIVATFALLPFSRFCPIA